MACNVLRCLAVIVHHLLHIRLMRELSSAPQGHLFELLVLPGAERRGKEFVAQLAHPGAKRRGESG